MMRVMRFQLAEAGFQKLLAGTNDAFVNQANEMFSGLMNRM
jgi:hypothetical protein